VPAAQAFILPRDCGIAAACCTLHRDQSTQENSLEALQSANAPDARSVVQELDEADGLDGHGVPGGEFIAEELTVQVIPQAEDEFTCYSCFLVRHRSQIARQKDGHAYCSDCEG
jgi:hypothetical protein